MDLIELLKSALFGLVQGITEWLPVSSTGHMLLLNQFVTLNVSSDFFDMFLVVIQLGSILAVCVLYFHELNPFSSKKTPDEKRSTWRLWAQVIVGCIPAAVFGIFLDDLIEEKLSGPFVIAATLIVYGIAFIVIENHRAAKAARVAAGQEGRHLAGASTQGLTTAELADADARISSIEEMDWKTAIGIGCFQVLAMIPGTSRSGSTIIGGLLLGCSRTVAAEFTFYLAIPVMFGASALRLAKFFVKGNSFAPNETAILLVGSVVAFVVSLVVIRFLMSFIKKHDFKPFGWYRIVLGIAVAAYFLLVH